MNRVQSDFEYQQFFISNQFKGKKEHHICIRLSESVTISEHRFPKEILKVMKLLVKHKTT